MHDYACGALGRLRQRPPKLDKDLATQLRLMVQVMYQRHQSTERGPQTLDGLSTGLQAFLIQRDWPKRQVRYEALSDAFVSVCRGDFTWMPEELEALLGIRERGTHRELGLGIYVCASLFNHSCAPNAVLVQRSEKLDAYSLTDIEAGEAVCVAYVDPRSEKAERRAQLLASFGFECRCPRCQGLLSACPKRCSACPKRVGYLIPSEGGDWCSVCGLVTASGDPPVQDHKETQCFG